MRFGNNGVRLVRFLPTLVVGCALLAPSAPADARPHYPGDFSSDAVLARLKEEVGARPTPLEGSEALGGLREKLTAARAGRARVRILQIGDSHIASDYITGRIRHRLQAVYGNAGRGFVHVGQRWGYGGRRIAKIQKREWTKDRIVDTGRAGLPFGFSGYSLESRKKGARLSYRVQPDERWVRIYAYQQPNGGTLEATLEGVPLGRFDLRGPERSVVWTLDLESVDKPPVAKRSKMRGPPGGLKLQLVASGRRARLFGLSFERDAPGLIYESVGPVGADAKVYLQLGRDSFREHLAAHAPDAIVVMVGGNDALKIRKGWTDLKRIRRDHESLVALLRLILPEVAIVMWAPMDAGRQKKKKIVSQGMLPEVRAMQREVAAAHECAFWDTLQAMGGPGAVAAWHRAGLMNKDLVHPRKPAADLLGDLYADAFLAVADRP